jgi:hypothetical protein
MNVAKTPREMAINRIIVKMQEIHGGKAITPAEVEAEINSPEFKMYMEIMIPVWRANGMID